MQAETAIVITLVAYKLALLGIGFLASRRTHDEEEFYLAGRRLGPLVAAISASASSSSGWTLLGVSGAAYTWGLGALWLFPACVGGFLLNWLVVAPRLSQQSRERGALTLTSFLGSSRADTKVTLFVYLSAAVILVALGIYVGQQFNAAGKTFQETFDLDAQTSILIGATIVIVYTLLGGFLAVSITDTLQGLVMAATAIAVPTAAVISVGGPGELFASLTSSAGERGLFRGFENAAAIGFVLGLLGIGIGYPGQPHVVNRFMALRQGSGQLARARTFAILWAVIVYSGMLIAGWCGHLHFAETAMDGEKVLIALTADLFPPVLAGIMLAATLSAIMSTADSLLLVGGSTLSHDLRLATGSRARRVLLSRAAVLGLSVLGVVIALFGNPSIFEMTLFAWGLLASTFGPLVLVAIFDRRPRPITRLSTASTGVLLTLASQISEEPTLFQVLVIPFVAALTVALVGRRLEGGHRS